jgi:Flp pilus assembly protein TadD
MTARRPKAPLRGCPCSSRTRSVRGVASWKLGRHDRAIPDFDEAIRLAPEDPALVADRGLAHRATGDLEAAAAVFRSAIRLDPSYARGCAELLRGMELAEARDGR